MDISSIRYIQSHAVAQAAQQPKVDGDSTFDSIFSTALGMLDETNQLQNTAESLEIQFALGLADNTHDLQIAQKKANTALAYTVAVRDKVLEAYNSIMNMQM
ncbi:MAG: flagellar hook-basal body complex protein FliE [Eubacterium sp.]|nr:flagellar hook-basal body complex protein FliE [Eubacterium sp.]